MFQQLLESNAVLQPRLGGSAISAAGHVAVITIIVALTAASGAPLIEAPVERPIFVASPPPIATPVAQHAVAAPAPVLASACPAPCLVLQAIVPVEIPVGIAPVDLTAAVATDIQFGSPSGGSRTTGAQPGAIGAHSGVSADATWLADQVERPVVLRPGSPTPTFPVQLRSAGVTGVVMAEFVVDTLGRIEPKSVHLLIVDHEQFGQAVRRVLPRLKFIPAEVQGRKVRQLVRLPFRFDLHGV